MAASACGDRKIQHFNRNIVWAQLRLVEEVLLFGDGFLNCRIDLYVIDGTLTGQKYRDLILRSLVVPHFDGHPLASRPMLVDDKYNQYSARLSATGGNRSTTLVIHDTGYESDRTVMGLSRTKSERTYPEVSKHSGIRDCFDSGMATVPSTQTETLDSWNEETCSGTAQDARRLYSLLTLS